MRKFMPRMTAFLLSGIVAFGSFSMNVYAQTTTFSSKESMDSKTETIDTNAKYEEGEVLVMYSATTKSPFSTYSLDKAGLTGDVTVEDTYTFPSGSANGASSYSTQAVSTDTTVVCVSSKTLSTEQMMDSFSGLANVTAVEPNYKYQATSLSDSTLSDFNDYLWGLNNSGQNAGTADDSVPYNTDVNADAITSAEKTDESAPVVAILDTGFDYTNKTLASHIWTNPYQGNLAGEHGYNFLYDGDIYKDTNPMDDNGHGSHCAGIINSVMNSYGKDVKIMGLKWLSAEGYGDLSDVISAYSYIYAAQRLGVNVVAANNSWGGGGSSTILNSIVDIVGKEGCISVFSAGNSTSDNDTIDAVSNMDSDYAVVVAASNEDGELATFSSYGANTVDVAAPGTDILSTVATNCFNPSIYDDTQKSELCSSFNNYNASSYSALFDSAKATQSSYAFTDSLPSESSPYTAYGTVPFSGNSDVTISTDSSSYFGKSTDGTPSSVKISVNGKAGKSYRIAVPYAVGDSSCAENISSMIRYEAPDSEEVSGLLYIFDCPSSVLSTNKVSEFNTLSFDTLASNFVGGLYVDGNTNYWMHLDIPNNSTLKSDTKFMVLDLECLVDGAYSVYLDDFGISKESKEVSTVADYGKYDFYNGTSMACPYAVGAIGALSLLEEFQDATPLQKVNVLKSSFTKNASLSGKVASGGILDISKYLDSGYSVNPTISTVSVSGTDAIIKGANLKDCTLTINGTPCSGTVNSDSSEIRVAAADYINKYVKVVVTKNDASVTKTAFLVKGKDAYTTKGETYLSPASIGSMVSTGSEMYFTYQDSEFFQDDTLFYYNPNAVAVGKESTGAETKSTKSLIDFMSVEGPSADSFTDPSYDSDVWGEMQIKYSDQLVYMNNCLYTIVNASQSNFVGASFYSKQYLVKYDISANTWTTIKELDGNITNQTLCGYNGILYLMGGYDYTAKDFTTSVSKYDPSTGAWSSGTSLPEGRCGGKAIQSGNTLVYTMGYSFDQPAATGDLPKALTLPKTLTFNGTSWTTSSTALKAYNYSSSTINGKTIYYTNESLGLAKNSVLFTGVSCEGYGDTFTYTPSTDKYTAGKYTGIENLTDDYFQGTVIDDTMYGFYSNSSSETMSLKTMPVTSGLVSVETSFAKGSVETELSKYLPGSTITCNISTEDGYYVKSMKLKDSDGHQATVNNGAAKILATSNVKIDSKSIGKYVSKISLKESKMNYLFENSDSKHTYSLKATVSPETTSNYPVNSKLAWESSNPKYAKVNSAGKVTFLKAGIGKEVTITASSTDGSETSASCTITICNPVTKIKVSGKSETLSVGKSMKLSTKVTPSTATVTEVKWKSSNAKYATVSSDGKVVAKKAGKGKRVTITATSKDGSKVKGTYKVDIK